MPTTSPDALIDDPQAQAIAQLRARFLQRCEQRVVTMRSLVEQIVQAQGRADRGDIDDCAEELLRLAHEITGGGGTFGCPRLSEISAEFEAYLACCRAGRRNFDEQIASRSIAKLDEAIANAV